MTSIVRPWVLATACLVPRLALAQAVAIDTTQRYQTIDGFGTCMSEGEPSNGWWQGLYFQDMQFSVMRMDLTPNFMPDGGVTTDRFCSPWFSNPNGSLHLPQSDGGCGPDSSCTRPYTGPTDYANPFGGCAVKPAVMGPNIAQNVAAFDFAAVADLGHIAQLGAAQAAQLGDFKLYASLWSPAPWVKLSSGNTYPAGSSFPSPTGGTPWPFIWGGNFAGGILDLTGTTYSQFNDGTADTTSLTQFTRGLAAYLKGFQDTYGVHFYAISIQNELAFEEYYNSMAYPLAADYVTALKAVRAELDAQPDLASIRIFGPEDVIGGDAYGMYAYGTPGTPSELDKDLHFLQGIAADPVATAAIAGFNIHGYAADGVSAAGANSQLWDWWVNGWTASPAAGLPANVPGFASFKKASWMTETSGETTAWLANDSNNFPSKGAFGIAVGMHETLVAGQESAFLYWQLTDNTPGGDGQSLTGSTALGAAPKYNAMKHFARYIRPNSVRVAASVTGTQLLASAYVLDAARSLTVVLINESATAVTATLSLPASPAGLGAFETFTSSDGSYWNAGSVTATAGSASVTVPGYGVVTLYGVGQGATTSTSSSSGGATTSASSSGATGTSHATGSTTATSGASSTGGGTAASASGTTSGTGGGTSNLRVSGGCGCASGGGDPLALLAALVGLGLLRAGGAPTRRRAGR